MTRSTGTFSPIVNKLDNAFLAHFAEEDEVVAAGVDADPEKAVLKALYNTLAAWKNPHFIGRTCGILTALTPEDTIGYELGERDDCVLCDDANCQAYVHIGELVKGQPGWDTKLQAEVIVKVGPDDWRWFCRGEIGCAPSFAAADIKVSLIADYGGKNTRILDVWVGEKKAGELRLANGVYSYIATDLGISRGGILPEGKVSDCLFPPFAERVPSKRRRDRKAMYEELGLSEDADDFSFLEASGGKLVTSSITLRKHI